MDHVPLDLPYERTPDDEQQLASKAVREQFQLDPDLIVADTVVIKSAVLTGESGALSLRFPALFHEFQINRQGQLPLTVAKVAFIGNVDAVRGYGRLARDSANGAVNAAERA